MPTTCILTRSYQSPCGSLLLGCHQGALCLCDWVEGRRRGQLTSRLKQRLQVRVEEGDSPVLQQAARQLDEYFAGQRRSFSIPLHFADTAFRERVWQQLLSIPYGKTLSYGELARALGAPSAARAVAGACAANQLSIFIPCHRVIGRNGGLTGYSGGHAAKQHLLDLETKPLLRLMGLLGAS